MLKGLLGHGLYPVIQYANKYVFAGKIFTYGGQIKDAHY